MRDFEFYSNISAWRPKNSDRAGGAARIWTDGALGEALGQVFVAKTFSPDTKARTLAMTNEIEDGHGKGNRDRSLDDRARHASKHSKNCGPWSTRSAIRTNGATTAALTIKSDEFFGNVLRASEFERRRQLNKIGKPVDRTEWGMTPPTVNAYYNSQMNDINFPAGVLQPPLFDSKLDDAPNYGNTGATIGHELTHAFDDEGRQFDAKGNLKDWWTKTRCEGIQAPREVRVGSIFHPTSPSMRFISTESSRMVRISQIWVGPCSR